MQGGVKLLFTNRMGRSVLRSSKDREKKNPKLQFFLKISPSSPGETSDPPPHRSMLGEHISLCVSRLLSNWPGDAALWSPLPF